MMRTYYNNAGITIYHGDCREVLELLRLLHEQVDLLLADPPYGTSTITTSPPQRSVLATAKNYAPVAGDDKPFDPAHLLRMRCKTILWGANYYAERLPASSSWIVWDKVDGLPSRRSAGFNNNADCELAWSNLGGPARIFSHRWMGAMRASQRRERRVHPTEKPVMLMRWCLRYAKLAAGALVVDPYMGSGPVARACQDFGMRYIGCELSEAYCEQTVRYLRQEVAQHA